MRRSDEATKRATSARRVTALRVRGAVLLEVLIALAILIMGMAAVGMQVNVGLKIANNSEVATRAVMLARSKMAELDAGIVQLTPNEELEDDFGLMYPGWAWRIYIDQTDTPDLNMVTLQILYQPGVAFGEELTDYTTMTIVHTSYTLRATPANMDLQRDFGFTEEQLQEVSDNIPLPNFDPKNISPTMIGELDPEVLAEVLPKLMELLGSNAALLNTLPQATRNQLQQAMDQAGKAGKGKDGGKSGDGDGGPPNLSDLGGGNLGGGATGFDGGALGSGNRRGGNRDGSNIAPDAGTRQPGSGRSGSRSGTGGNRSGSGGSADRLGGGSSRFGGGSRLGDRGGNDSGSGPGPGMGDAPQFGGSAGTGGRRGSGFNGGQFGNRGGPRSGATPGGQFGRSGAIPNPGGRPGMNRDGLGAPFRVPSEQDLYGRGGAQR